MCISTRAYGLIVQMCAESTRSKTLGDSGTTEPSTTQSCESSKAPKKICQQHEKSLPESDGTPTELSCRPCHSHVRQEPQITQEFQRLLRLPLSKRVDQKEDNTHKHHVRHPATRRSQWRTREMSALASTALASQQPQETSSLHVEDSAVEVRAAPEAPTNGPCCRQCHCLWLVSNFFQYGPCGESKRTQTSSWHRPTLEPFDERSAWMSYGAHPAPHWTAR